MSLITSSIIPTEAAVDHCLHITNKLAAKYIYSCP